MTGPLHFAAQQYPGARIVLMLGKHQAGAVFPPVGDPIIHPAWVWRFWLSTGMATPEGRAKSELAAKNALLACAEQWLRDAGVGK
ncbi:MAG: hypothetical protein ACRCYS_15435 [Beijerinckiaceae bacterium]